MKIKIGKITLKDWEDGHDGFVRLSVEEIATGLHIFRLYPLTHKNNWYCEFRGSLGYLTPIFREKYKILSGDENEVKSIVDQFLIKMNKLKAFL